MKDFINERSSNDFFTFFSVYVFHVRPNDPGAVERAFKLSTLRKLNMSEITNWPQAFTIVGVAICVAIVLCMAYRDM